MKDGTLREVHTCIKKMQSDLVPPWEAAGVELEVYMRSLTSKCEDVTRVFKGDSTLKEAGGALVIANTAKEVLEVFAWIKSIEALRDLQTIARIEQARD